MIDRTAPIIAIATAPGRGAVGIVRASGTGLAPWVRALCQRDLTPREATLLPLRDATGQPLDQVIALFFPGPHSYTGEDVLELQAHGGPVVLQLILQRCLQVGQSPAVPMAPMEMPAPALLPHLRMARPGEFTERAYLNQKLDLAQAEAVADLIDASTEAAARSASRSLEGVFSREVQGLQEGLTHLRMLVEATLDFPEEDIDFLQQADARGQLDALAAQLLDLQARSRQGRLLREGIRVVIAGQPNAGKSSLLNALAGTELAIVTPLAGTTRDVIAHVLQIDGVPLHVIDTAGLRATDTPGVDEVERIGIERAWQQIEQADAVLFLHDLTRHQAPDYAANDARIAANLSQVMNTRVPVLHVWNKADVPGTTTLDVPENALRVSARTGEGLAALRTQLLTLAGWQSSQAEGVFMARERHLQALALVQQHIAQAQQYLQHPQPALDVLAEELRLSQQALGEITGEFTSDDLLGVIFSRFCIGK
jgi:tRNA modification GTPase